MAIGPESRNNLTVVIKVLDSGSGLPLKPPYLDLRPRVTGFSADDSYHTVTDGQSWANIALDRLGDAKSWWAIADLSGVVDPFTELETNVLLRCPSTYRYLFRILEGKK